MYRTVGSACVALLFHSPICERDATRSMRSVDRHYKTQRMALQNLLLTNLHFATLLQFTRTKRCGVIALAMKGPS
jgi:hypothetical protein